MEQHAAGALTTVRRRLVRFRMLPPGATDDAGRLLAARATRDLGDGIVSVLLPVHLAALGFGSVRIGIIATVTLLGSAAMTLGVGLIAGRFSRRWLLRRATVLLVITGLGFALVDSFWLLLPIAFVGTLNPSTGDGSFSCRRSRLSCPRPFRPPTGRRSLPGTAWPVRSRRRSAP